MKKTESGSFVQRLTVLIIAIAFCYALANSLSGVLINHIIDEFSITGTRQGLAVSMINLGVVAAVVAAPLFQGRIRKLTVMMLSCLLMAVALALCGSAGTEQAFYVLSVIFGLSMGWLDGYINSTLIDLHPNDSAVPMGLLHGFFGIGSLAMPLIATGLLALMVWRGLYYLVAALMLALAVIVLAASKGAKESGAESDLQENRLTLVDIAAFLKTRRNLLLLLIAFCAGAIQTGISCWIVRYMTVEFGNEALGAKCLSVLWVFSTVNRFVCPRIKTRAMNLLITGGICTAVSLVLGVILHSGTSMLIASALIGLCSGHFIPMLFIEAARGHRGSTTLTTFVISIAMSVGRILIPIVIAAAAAGIGNRIAMVLPAVTAVIAALGGLSALRHEKQIEIV